MKISRISAQAFRGFPKTIHFQLSKSVTIVHAPNGFGKTSLSEAFEWALYGEVARKARSQTPGEFGQDFLRSAHADTGDDTWAEVELLKDDGSTTTIKRVMGHRGLTALFVDGRQVNNVSEANIALGLAFRPCLGQSEIKAFIDTAPIERWKQISAILGLGGFEELRLKLMKIKNDTESYNNVSRTKELARRAIAPLIQPTENPLNIDPEGLHQKACEELKLSTSTSWPDIQVEVDKRIKKLFGKERPKSLDILIKGPEKIDFDEVDGEINKVIGDLPKHREWHKTNKMAKFSSLGAKLSKPPTCPYCGQRTLTTKRVNELKEIQKAAGKEPIELSSKFVEAITRYAAIKDCPVNTEVIGSLADALTDDAALTKRLLKLPASQEGVMNALTELGGLSRGFRDAVRSDSNAPMDEVQRLGNSVVKKAQELCGLYNTLYSEAGVIREQIQAKLSGLSVDETAQLEKLQQYKRLASNISYVRQAWAISAQQANLERFIRTLEQVERTVVRSKEDELAADVRKFYAKLSNSKSLEFKGFKVNEGIRRQAGLEATSYGVPVNPTSMFSEAQGNCLGLSLYFSQRVERNPGWATIILDDPVQSMDEDHKQNLITLLSELSKDRQILVFTHDSIFYRDLVSQFSSLDDYLGYEITKSDVRPEPEIIIRVERFEQLLAYAEQCAPGPSVQRESALNTIRKAIEVLVTELGAAENVSFTRGDDWRMKINKLKSNPLADTEVGTLLRIKGHGDPGSHEAPTSPTAGTLLSHIKDLRALRSKYLTPNGG